MARDIYRGWGPADPPNIFKDYSRLPSTQINSILHCGHWYWYHRSMKELVINDTIARASLSMWFGRVGWEGESLVHYNWWYRRRDNCCRVNLRPPDKCSGTRYTCTRTWKNQYFVHRYVSYFDDIILHTQQLLIELQSCRYLCYRDKAMFCLLSNSNLCWE